MKKLWFFLCCLPVCSFAQITLDHEYDSTAYWVDINYALVDSNEGKYYRFDGQKFTIFNLDHTLYKELTPQIPGVSYIKKFSNITRHLFNTDDKIELLLLVQVGNQEDTYILNEDNEVVFAKNSTRPIFSGGTGTDAILDAVFNTPTGTKLILVTNGRSQVYSLPGRLPHCPTQLDVEEKPSIISGGSDEVRAFPNPTSGSIRLQYQLPVGATHGEIVISSLEGSELRRYSVGGVFSDILINARDLPAGTYFYRLNTEKTTGSMRKFIVKR